MIFLKHFQNIGSFNATNTRFKDANNISFILINKSLEDIMGSFAPNALDVPTLDINHKKQRKGRRYKKRRVRGVT